MTEQMIRVNTRLMERDLITMGRSLSNIYQLMEGWEVSRAEAERFWEGAAKEAYFQALYGEWKQLEEKARELQEWAGRWEQIKDIYQSCERRVMTEVEGLRI